MTLPRLDCDIFRGSQAVPDASAFVALNPVVKPAQMVFAGSTAAVQGVGSQVAYRLAIDYFVGVLSHLVQIGQKPVQSDDDEEPAVEALEAAFRLANSSVYGFGHKLAAGGRMAASLLAFIVDQHRFAAARVGQGSVYLFRNKQLFPFFGSDGIDRSIVGDIPEYSSDPASQKQAFIGSHSIIDVEVASVTLHPGDYLVAFSRPLTTLNETLLFQHLEVVVGEGFPEVQPYGMAEQMCLDVFTQADTLSFGCMVGLGPEVIYCSRIVA